MIIFWGGKSPLEDLAKLSARWATKIHLKDLVILIAHEGGKDHTLGYNDFDCLYGQKGSHLRIHRNDCL